MIYRALIGLLVVVVFVGLDVQGFSPYWAKQEALASEQQALRLKQHEQLVAANAAKKDWQGKRIFMEPRLASKILAFSDPKRGVKCRWTTSPDPEPAFFANNSPSVWRQLGHSVRHTAEYYYSFCFVDESVDLKVEGGSHVCTAVQDYLNRSKSTGLTFFRETLPVDFGGTPDFYVPQWHDFDHPALRDFVIKEVARDARIEKEMLDQPYVRLQMRVLHDASGAHDYPDVAYRLVMPSRLGGVDRFDHPELQQERAAVLAGKDGNEWKYARRVLASHDPSGGDVQLSKHYWRNKSGHLISFAKGEGLFRFRGHYYLLHKNTSLLMASVNPEDTELAAWPSSVLSMLRRHFANDKPLVRIYTRSIADRKPSYSYTIACDFTRKDTPEAAWRKIFPGRELPVESTSAKRKQDSAPPREGIAMAGLLTKSIGGTYYRENTSPYSGRMCLERDPSSDRFKLVPTLARDGWDVFAALSDAYCYMDRDFPVDYHDGAHVCTAVRDYLNARADDGLNLSSNLPVDFGGTADFFAPRWESIHDPSLARSLGDFIEQSSSSPLEIDPSRPLQRMVIDTDADGIAESYYRFAPPAFFGRIQSIDSPLLVEALARGEFAWQTSAYADWRKHKRYKAYGRTEAGWHDDPPIKGHVAYFRFRGRYYNYDETYLRGSFLKFLSQLDYFFNAETPEIRSRENETLGLIVAHIYDRGIFNAQVRETSFSRHQNSKDTCRLQFKFDLPSFWKTYFPEYPIPQNTT